jgi:hypothetical protein
VALTMAASRSTLFAASLIASPILFAIAAAVLVLATRALILFAGHADLFDLAGSIEGGGELPDAVYLARFVKANGLDRATADCGDSFTRASLTVTLAMFEAAAAKNDAAMTDFARKNALRAAEHRLVCNPLDGNAWLRFAIVKSRGKGPMGAIVDDLRMSYWTAPSEAWIVEPRLTFATDLYLAGETGFETEYLDDLRRFASFEPPSKVAEAFVAISQPVRERMRPLIDALPDARRKTIITEIDGRGVDYWEP